MFTKVLAVVLLSTYSLAIEDVPTSFTAFNNYHNTIKHIQSRHDTISKSGPVQFSSHAQSVPYHYNPPKSSGYSGYAAPSHGLSSHASVHSSPSVRYTSFPVSTHSSGQYSAPPAYHSVQYPAPQHSVQFAAPSHYAAPASHGLQYSAPTQALHYGQPAASQRAQYSGEGQGGYSGHHEEEHTHPKYEFSYGVEDHHTGDIHSHKETRDGDHTQGEYSLREPDGTIRTVKYSVDKHSGFNAVVEKSGHNTHPQQQAHHEKNAYY